MKKLLQIFIILLSIYSFGQTEKKCQNFKTGEFKYLNKNLPIKITRTDSTQIEKDLVSGMEIHTTINWQSECKYILTYKKILNSKQDYSQMIGKKIYAEITHINENWIKVHFESEASNEDIKFVKIN